MKLFKTNNPLVLIAFPVIISSASMSQAQTCSDDILPRSSSDQLILSVDTNSEPNGTVIDAPTGLQWMQCSIGQTFLDGGCSGNADNITWTDALNYAKTFNSSGGFAGYADWRVPNIKELSSLVEFKCHSPAINLEFFKDTPSAAYWSSTASFDSFGNINPSAAHVVNFRDGSDTPRVIDSLRHIRLVRDNKD